TVPFMNKLWVHVQVWLYLRGSMGTDEVFQALEDNQVTLSVMKASRFVKAFEKEVDHWERSLSLVLEVIEMILTVQRQWMYLENIFLADDIRKQLVRETAEFDDVNSSWKIIMDRLDKDKNALRGTHYPGLLEKLSEMNTKLEEIQKSLDMYLETKRQIFPRFYFLSNDDLLEILGQSRNPEAVQPHLKKCFDNIKSLRINKVYSIPTQPLLTNAWLCDVERTMRWTLKDCLKNCSMALKKMPGKRGKWVREWPGQVSVLCLSSKNQCLHCVTQVSMLSQYSEAIRGNLSKILRLKIVALVTVEVHARDVISKLAKAGCCDVSAFDWLCQLRLYWDKTNTHFHYGYEYLGNSGRLVITPLTDRCYMTLTTALHLHRGGSPKGPAGTGKTETVKDLGKSLGMYVIVVNCSEGLDFKSMGRMYSGLAQTGAWGCFDEFNRINIEVLSVVAQQILSILSALSAGLNKFTFEGRQISLVWSCGIFITMNPGYAGRTELPDNLKSMFRPISMVVPDSTLIAEIMLFAEGFNNCKVSIQHFIFIVFTLYSLAVQQLSKQDHYDFGLRALTSLLRYAGKKRRILLMSMKDMNIAKLTSIDLPLFNGIIQDLFPAVETPTIDYGKVACSTNGLQVTPFTVTKVIQLYETKNSRHSSMIVGKTGSGKTVTWRTLQNALSTLHRKGEPEFNIIRCPLNPKAVSLGELYGEYNLSTNEWTDGVLSSLMRTACADEKPDEKWIVFDGPVDTLWIESMNSVMDDNKVLTLINGERISMPEQVSLLFEVEDLAVASPATVSRCGMVYNDYSDLTWKPYVQSWMEKRQKVWVVMQLFDRHIDKTLTFKKTHCKELVPITELNGVASLCRLYDSLATPENGVNPADSENFGRMVELWFIFSLIWSVCASVDEDGRKKIDNFLREVEGSFPNKVYTCLILSCPTFQLSFWRLFNYHLSLCSAPFYKIMVPTVDTVRYHYLVKALVSTQHPVLLTGPVGTGKTSVAQNVLQSLDSVTWAMLTINMSSQTSSNNVQEIIESRVEKRIKGVYVPVGGKRMVVFLDDLNMPAMDDFGSQPPLELLRLWIDYGFWYDRQKQILKCIKDIYLLAAMGPPGGGRTQISGRLQSRFNLINMTFPTVSRDQKLQEFEEEVKPIGGVLTQATLELYHAITARFLPTPAKIHYLFNLRDISKVFQGLLRAHKDFHDTKQSITRLWIHECFRVFSDRLVDHADMETFVGLLSEKLASYFDVPYHTICPNKQPPIFGTHTYTHTLLIWVSLGTPCPNYSLYVCFIVGDFLREPHVYEDLLDFKALKVHMENELEDYNLTPGVVPMSLVLFRDAIEHVTRLVRVISQLRGNMLLVGIGGSGRQSLTRLAAYICKFTVFQVEVTKQYRKQEFREDIKKLYRLTGVENKPTVFLFNDTQIVDESFLEDINNILSSGEVPNLYKADELDEVCVKDNILETSDAMFNYLIERVRNNLHIVLCMSPVGDPFRNRIRQYPALVNCTTIDWFSEWPRDALLEVAERFLDGLSLGSEDGTNVASIFVTMHQSVAQFSHRMKVELKRHNYVTPTNYLELVSGYKKLLYEKRGELGEQVSKLRNGLFKIDDTRSKVEGMSVELEEAKKKVAEFQKQELGVPCSPGFSFAMFLSKPTAVREWNIQGLPSDAFSTENGVIVTRGNRWPLMVDPQGQALKWIKNMESKRGLKVIDLQMPDFLRILENAVQFGSPVLLQNVQDELDPSLAPILNKSLTKVGGRFLLKLGDKEVEYSPEFRFYMTTKLSNPHYTPEISSKTTIVNFAVKEQAQLLGIVVRKERPELEEQKDSLVINIASGKRKLQELEDEILRLLNEASGSLLDDVQLVNTLQTSKVTATEVAEQLEISELTESQIDTAREAYRPCAQRASILFFVLNDLGYIDPMYQFSLDAYINLFTLSIESSPRSHKLEERINNLNRHHTYAVYRYTCRGLFECHKLLFSFHMCAKILEASSKLNIDEYSFFLRGGLVRAAGGSVFVCEWQKNCNELQRMLIVRSLRQDRISLCVTTFVINNLGSQFVEPPILDMKAVTDSTMRTPLIFVLSPGVDPTAALVQLAETSGMGQRFFALSLGQGQAPIATRLIKEGVANGHWVFLANCHLSLSWMCELDKLVDELQIQECHPDFRLWLSSSPHPEFPIAILQTGIKITTEPPRVHIYTLLHSISQFSRCSRPLLYRKLLFALCFFHSVIQERRKFLQLGWNIVYSFNDSDLEVSESLLSLYLDEYEEIPWDALKFLIAGINYGGHVTDDWDRRLLTTYINQYFCPAVIDTPFFKVSSLVHYYVPRDGPQSSYLDFIGQLPALEHPELFGQHPNADIASQITEARTLFHTLLSLQPQVTSTDTTSPGVLEFSADVLQKIPAEIDYEGTRKLLKDDLSPLNVVLLQEIQRYNALLHTIRSVCESLEKGIKGLVVMSSSLEEIFHNIHDARVPPLWEKVYPSLKPLASWTRDLCQRVEQFARWAETARPPVLFWLSGFTFPTGFLTAVLQSSARQNNVSIDTLSWEFIVSTMDDKNLHSPPKDGVFIQGLYLEGAGWDKKASCLVEAEPMQLFCPMPSIHFKPVESHMYSCPCYYYPVRSGGSGRPSFVVPVDLKSGAVPYDHWIKRGTALLMSLDN
uniref:Dynein, axonemal, heavy chain 2 n=1 Tax=Cyprinus carpio TaxID=7962 RepID=A0A8C1Q525_CYPCA